MRAWKTLAVLGLGCLVSLPAPAGENEGKGPDRASTVDRYAVRRAKMIETQLKPRGIRDQAVLRAMGEVPRQEFVAPHLKERAYDDSALPIGHRQTISQPYIVALMTELARVEPGDTVLDVGTGSGYQAAVLAEIVERVYSIEIIPELAEEAEQRLARLGYDNVVVRTGDGWKGWPEHAPFDAVVLAAAPTRVPPPLIEQLKPGARLVLPVGDYYQELVVITRNEDGSVTRSSNIPVRFVPMTGIALEGEDE